MSANWYDGYQKELALERLQERFPGGSIEILDTFDIAWSSWECDSQGALINVDGKPRIVVVDAVGDDSHPGPILLLERLAEYRRLIAATEAVLDKYRSLGGLEGAAFVEAEGLEHMRENARVRRSDETDDDYAARLKLWGLT